MRFRLEGPISELHALLDFLQKEEGEKPIAVDGPEQVVTTFDRSSQGMDPVGHVLVVFAGHLSAALVHDLIIAAIEKLFGNKSKISIKQSSDDEKK